MVGGWYGGLHLLGWDGPFGTRAEMLLWRLAGRCVAGAPVVMAPVIMLPEVRWLREGWLGVLGLFVGGGMGEGKRGEYEWAKVLTVVVMAPLVPVCPLLTFGYVFARIYLVVEALRNVGRLPVGVYSDVDWPGHVPHIS